MKRLLNVTLTLIGILCIVALFLAHEDPFARKIIYTYTGFRPVVPNAKAWYKITCDGAVGALVTLFFYLLVVRWPDYQKRRRLKRGLARQYRIFKEDCIGIMLMVADGSYSGDVPEKLMEQEKFREYFKGNVTSGRSRWDEFVNNLNERYLRELIMNMEIFRDEIAFILNNTDIPRDEPFEFLKRLSTVIYSKKGVTLDYDELKFFARFLWEIFSGWDWISGYRKEDIIQRMIDDI